MPPELNARLRPFRRRLRLLLAERAALWAGAAVAAAALPLAVVIQVRGLWVDWRWFPMAIAAAMLMGWVWGLLTRLSPFQIARATEQRLALKERLSSATVLAEGDQMVAALHRDAVDHLAGPSPRATFPRRFGLPARAFAAAAVALCLVMILPQLAIFQSAGTRAQRQQMKRKGAELVKIAREIERNPPPSQKQLAMQIAENMRRLGKDLERHRVTERQALKRMNQLSRQVQRTQDKLAAQNSRQAMSAASRRLDQTAAERALERKPDAGAIAAEIERREGIKLPPGAKGAIRLTPEQVKALARHASQFKDIKSFAALDSELAAVLAQLLANEDYLKALEILERLADKLGSQEARKLTPEEAKRLAENMRAMAEALKNTDLKQLAKSLREAAEALEKMDPAEAAKLLKGG
jgi:hypothetical protein